MTEDARGRQRNRRRLRLTLAALATLLAVLIAPPLVNLHRYQSEIAQLLAASLGRPVRLSSVELRLLPLPGLVLTDLIVEEDPAYGAEPILHANTVTASFRLLALWRGRLEISRISVDEASLNLVRTDDGRWNLDPLFRTAAAHAGAGANGLLQSGRMARFPYLEATNSRINIKNGAEKLPLSLVNTDLSFWQENPGDWRIRLRGQPARTDVSLNLFDTGTVRLEASVRGAAELRQMPVHLDLEWRDAELGQLTRLAIGSDPGWRGDLTGELHLDGTADAAQITTRLRATGVHREEFAPAAPMDFDATCGFVYHFSGYALENLVCDSPLGDGRIHLAGDLPGAGRPPHLSVDLDRIPVAAGLDALRTVRSDFAPGLEAGGTISGKITYAEHPAESGAAKPAVKANRGNARSRRVLASNAHAVAQGPLTGSLTVEGFQLSGDGLSTPIHAPRLVLQPSTASLNPEPGQTQAPGQSQSPSLVPALLATIVIPAGGVGPLTVTSRLALSGYQVTVRGQASLARTRELAHIAGMADAAALDSLAGDPVTLDLSAEGPWMSAQTIPFSSVSPAGNLATKDEESSSSPETLSGTITLRNANWKADFLANHVEIAQATLHLGNGETRWDPVVFSYGSVNGTVSLNRPSSCAAAKPCPINFHIQFGDLDASDLQAALLGAHEPGTLLSTLIAKLSPSASSSVPAWPQLQGTAVADSLILGPVTLRNASATLRILSNGAGIDSLDAEVLGGTLHGTGALRTGDKPVYTLQGEFAKLSPAAVGQLLGLRWSGGALVADGKIELSGFTDDDLAESAKGTLHFEWRHGAVSAESSTRIGERAAAQASPPDASLIEVPVPAALARFDRWTGDAEIADGIITLKQNQVQQGSHKREVGVAVTLSDPPKVTFAAPKETLAKKR